MPLKMVDKLSANFEARRGGMRPELIILHYTDTLSVEQTLHFLHGEVSAHYVVDEDGSIIRVVDEEYRAWHAGKSYWQGETDINSLSIGIEIQNPGHQFGYRAFPDAQMAAVEELCLDIINRHKIFPQDVLGHSDISIGRKIDPDYLFPWKRLALSGIGLWPSGDKHGVQAVEPESLRAPLAEYGYDPHADIFQMVTAFQRHFEPEVFAAPDTIGIPSTETRRRLDALLAQKILK
jgi:N-acetylmuramoyl-L-alanine amidase